jgi:GH25 family lysozyme M1 (1,4-beta-N-acetylmuramidase)
MIKGCDISSHQGVVDFHSLRDNLEFVIIRSTYGNGYTDTQFIRNRDEARKVGLCLGFYHYAYPQYNTAQAEADWFTKIVSCQAGEILILDFEEKYADIVNWCKTFLDKVTSNMGFKPLIYLNQSQVKSYNWQPIIDAGYGLWLAQYDYNADGTPVSTPWPMMAMRQYSNQGQVGSLTPLDLDVFYGTVDQFKKYGNPPSLITEPPTIPPQPPVEPTPPEPVIDWEAKYKICDIERMSYKTKFDKLVTIIIGKGWWWTKYAQIKQILTA